MKMQQSYAIGEVLTEWCVAPTWLGTWSTEDLGLAMGTECDAEALVAAAKARENRPQQISRVRQTWAAIRNAITRRKWS